MNCDLKENLKTIIVDNKEHKLCEFMFGVIEMDHNSPLSCVSEANNSFSIDYFKGCPFQCAYCHVQGIYEDLDENYHMLKKAVPRSKFTVEQIIDALCAHPYFVKDESIISIATSSTEPFASEMVINNTLNIMEYFVQKGYKNPFWIVTKAGIPNNISERLKKITNNGNKIMISICWANNPKIIEPVQNNRFKNLELLKESGVIISWYLRPLVKEWSANKKTLEDMMKYVSENYLEYIDMIVPGGLRWTEGIEFGMHDMRNLPMPKLIKKYNKKTLSTNIEKTIVNLAKKYFPNIPVYFNSSCAISHMLNRTNIAMLNLFDKNICRKSLCYNKCKNNCQELFFNERQLNYYEEVLQSMGINIKLKEISFKNKIVSIPDFDTFNYKEKEQIRKTIALLYSKERNDES